MFDARLLREDPDPARRACARKGVEVDIDEAHRLAVRRPAIIHELETLRAEKNRVSDAIAEKKKAKEDAAELIEAMKAVGPRVKTLEKELAEVEGALDSILLAIPNLPHDDVQDGGEDDAVELRRWGEPPAFGFEPKPHWDLGESLGLLDLPRGARIAGSGFPLYRGMGARLERALIQFFLDVHVEEHGYTEWMTPFLANRDAMTGAGQLPKFANEMYHTDKDDDLYLIPTSEVPLAGIRREEIVAHDELPLYYTAFSPCFRREAGAAGKDTRGILRVHQFNKVELVKYCAPETSWDELEKMLADAEDLLQRLGLHYRVVRLAAGDMSFASAMTCDLEVWAPGVGRYLEVSSVSNCTDFQARRSNTRFRDADGKVRFLHTLNGSGLACPRIWIALVEAGQQEDGSVVLPEPLRPYLGGQDRIAPA